MIEPKEGVILSNERFSEVMNCEFDLLEVEEEEGVQHLESLIADITVLR